MKRIFALLTAMLLAVGCLPLPVGAESEPSVSAGCAVLMDADTGELLYARHPDRPGLIASTTKIMTAWLACQEGDLDRVVTVPAEAVGVEGTSLYLREGERLTREELLYGTMIQSGNDAALALAIDVGGSEAAFVERMNETARGPGPGSAKYPLRQSPRSGQRGQLQQRPGPGPADGKGPGKRRIPQDLRHQVGDGDGGSGADQPQ